MDKRSPSSVAFDRARNNPVVHLPVPSQRAERFQAGPALRPGGYRIEEPRGSLLIRLEDWWGPRRFTVTLFCLCALIAFAFGFLLGAGI